MSLSAAHGSRNAPGTVRPALGGQRNGPFPARSDGCAPRGRAAGGARPYSSPRTVTNRLVSLPFSRPSVIELPVNTSKPQMRLRLP